MTRPGSLARPGSTGSISIPGVPKSNPTVVSSAGFVDSDERLEGHEGLRPGNGGVRHDGDGDQLRRAPNAMRVVEHRGVVVVLAQPAGVLEELARCDPVGVGEVGQEPIDPGGEVDLAFIGELQHDHRDEGLGDAADVPLDETVIAIVVIGARRPFVLRPRAPGGVPVERVPAGSSATEPANPGREAERSDPVASLRAPDQARWDWYHATGGRNRAHARELTSSPSAGETDRVLPGVLGVVQRLVRPTGQHRRDQRLGADRDAD